MHVCVRVCVCVCVWVCVSQCVYVHEHAQCHTHTHTLTPHREYKSLSFASWDTGVMNTYYYEYNNLHSRPFPQALTNV